MAIECWAVVEIMGHIKTAGKASEETHFGVPLLRVDVQASATDKGAFRTQYYGGGSIFAFHPTDEDTARAAAASFSSVPLYETTIEQLVERQRQRAVGGKTRGLSHDSDYDPNTY
jgi:hypothetical protein